MKIELVRIGNSKGIPLPKAVIEQCRLEAGIDLEVRGREIVLTAAKSTRQPREGWSQAFAGAADEQPQLDDLANDFDDTEWTWPEPAPVRAKRT